MVNLSVLLLQISSVEAEAATASVTTEGLIFSRGSQGAWDSASVGNPVVGDTVAIAKPHIAHCPAIQEPIHHSGSYIDPQHTSVQTHHSKRPLNCIQLFVEATLTHALTAQPKRIKMRRPWR